MTTRKEENEERAIWAMLCLNAAPEWEEDPEELEGQIIDLITNLLHLAAQNEHDPDAIARMAIHHYYAEAGK